MAYRNNIGKTVYYSTALPATNNKAGFEALTWVELEYPVSLPQFGVTHGNIDVPALSGFTAGVKGAATGMDTTGSAIIKDSTLTTNQLAFKAICDGALGNCALKIGTGTGAATESGLALATGDKVEYAAGYVHSYQDNAKDNSTYEGFQYGFHQNGITVKDVEPA